ncbi:hypothetical protein Hanom_Chr16g01475791 [Helianthus anomalus]
MEPKNNSHSLLNLIEEYDPIFLEIPYDFATLLWGEQLPYITVVKDDFCIRNYDSVSVNRLCFYK